MSHLSTLALHQLRLGELASDDAAAAEAHLAACERCRRRADAQQAQRAAFEAAPVPPAILAASAPANRPWPRWIASVVAVAAAAMIGVSLAWGPHPETTRIKGDMPEIELWVRSDAGVRVVHAGEKLGPGDVVQVKYATDGAAYAILAGRDQTGEIEVYGEVPLHADLAEAPFALTLDGTPGTQEFFLVTGRDRFDADAARAAIRGEREDLDVRDVSVGKEPW